MTMAVTYGVFAGETVVEGGVERIYVPDTLGSTAMLMDTSGNVTDAFPVPRQSWLLPRRNGEARRESEELSRTACTMDDH